jgi:hypothetical protein
MILVQFGVSESVIRAHDNLYPRTVNIVVAMSAEYRASNVHTQLLNTREFAERRRRKCRYFLTGINKITFKFGARVGAVG